MPNKTLGAAIFAMRERAGVHQVTLANRLGWVQSKLSKIETDKQHPRAADLEKILVQLEATSADRARVLEILRAL